MKLAQRLESIHPSATIGLGNRAKALAASGVDVANLAAGEPDFDTPQFIKDAAATAIREGFTKYTATAGILELREAICQKLKRENQLSYGPDQILVSCGAKHSFFNFCQAVLGDGDEVVIFAPYWVSYPEIVKLAGGRPIIVETKEEEGYAPNPAALRSALSQRTAAIVLNSPCNPTGAVLSKQVLQPLAEVVRDHRCLMVTDDIYEKLLYGSEPFVNIANAAPGLIDRVVVINGMSKAFAMTGWRLGYAAGPKQVISAMTLVQEQATSNPSSITQKASVAALLGPAGELSKMVSEFKARRDLTLALLKKIPGVHCHAPDGTFYAFPNMRNLIGRRFDGQTLNGSVQISEILLERFKVAVVAGLPFGAEGHVRISFAASRVTIEKGLARIADFVSALQ